MNKISSFNFPRQLVDLMLEMTAKYGRRYIIYSKDQKVLGTTNSSFRAAKQRIAGNAILDRKKQKML